ncbi:hypothetical protein SBRCBS47491_009129 [Sporothrix bragantina]|uniref:Zn(2)-C6 fungal-type domain-containing protein n=1 Tax=Sporothrix bragantina TaxID=671064 RepID=A0ABP0CVH8_9PEZI
MTTPASPQYSPPARPDNEHPPTKRPRKQVSRACDWCRARKIRCDNAQPCKACRQRDAQCTHKGIDDEPRTLPMALRENEKLKQRVRELEAMLASSSSQAMTPSSDNTSPPSNLTTTGHQLEHSSSTSTRLAVLSLPTFSSVSKPQWRGIYVDTAHSGRASYYGASSFFYFVSRIGSYLGNVLQQPLADRSMQLRGPSKRVHRDAEAEAADNLDTVNPVPSANDRCRFLSRSQEEALLRIFWEGYHCQLPVIDEVEFRRHYASLWEPARTTRKSSPLVDIVLALCLQYGYAYIPPAVTSSTESGPGAPTKDGTSAGRGYYRRSQSLLLADLESPSLATVQSYIFATAYLCCASFQNMSHILVAQAIRTAQVIGLHTEPAADMPYGEKELRRRIWWVLWMMDTKISSKLGRPFLIDCSQVTVNMFSDDEEAASYNGAALSSYGGVTWLSYARHANQLYRVYMCIFGTLWDNFGVIIHRKALSCVYNDAAAVEECAKVLCPKLHLMKAWVNTVPSGLKMRRRGGGDPYCTNCAAVEIDSMAPIWLQRQCVCLELTYHNAMVDLTRPFITFYSHPGTYTQAAEHHATTCVDHAVSFTLIMHHVVTETDLMNNWSEYFCMQWNTAITIVGFILAYPIHQSTLKARRALDKAIAVFDNFVTSFPVSADAAAITRDLAAKADMLAGRASSSTVAGVGGSSTTTSTSASTDTPTVLPNNAATPVLPIWGTTANPGSDDLTWLDPSQQDGFGQFMDWGLSNDASSSFERFFNPGNLTAW